MLSPELGPDDNTEKLSRRARALINAEFRNIILGNVAKRTATKQLLTPQTQSASKVSRTNAVKTARKKIQEEWEALKNGSIISTESPKQNSSDVLLGVVAFIEINNLPKSIALRVILENMGATVKDDFCPVVTHVIFKRGSFDTFKRAKLLNVHLVSVLWIEACKNSRKKIPEELFPVVDYFDYTSPRTFRKIMEKASNESQNLVQRVTRQKKPAEPNQRNTRSSNKSDTDSSESHVVLQISTDDSGKKNDAQNKKNKVTNKRTDKENNTNDSESIMPKVISAVENKRLFASEKDESIDNDSTKKKRLNPKLKRKLFNLNILDSSSNIDNLSESSRTSTPIANPKDINPYQIPKKRTVRKKAVLNRGRTKARQESVGKNKDSSSENESFIERREQVQELLKLTQQQNEECKQEKVKNKRLIRVKKTKRKPLTQEERDSIRTANKIARRAEKQMLRTTQPRSCRKVNIYRDGIERPSLVSTSLHSTENASLEQSLRTLGGFTFKPTVESDTTHLVAGDARRTINLLKAVARGCWVLSKQWVEDSLAAGHWVQENDYELVQFSPAVQKCRLERQALGDDYHMDIFQDCGTIFISNHCSHCGRKDLRALVVLCSGRIVTEPSSAKIVVGEKVDNVTCVSERWILDSVQAGRCKSLKKYLIV